MASNAFLATRISSSTRWGTMCRPLGIDFRKVAEGKVPPESEGGEVLPSRRLWFRRLMLPQGREKD